jgi:hypothetical protein
MDDVKEYLKERMRWHFFKLFATSVSALKTATGRDVFLNKTPSSGIETILCDFSSVPHCIYVFSKEENGRVSGRFGLLDKIHENNGKKFKENFIVDEINRLDADEKWQPMSLRQLVDFLGLGGEKDCGLAHLSYASIAKSVNNNVVLARLSRDDLVRNDRVRLDKGGLDHLKLGVDQNIMQKLGSCDDLTWRIYDFYAAPGDIGTIRRKALEYYPIFGQFFSDRFSFRRFLDSQVAEKQQHEAFLASEEYEKKLNSPEERGGVVKKTREWMLEDKRELYPAWLLSEKAVRKKILEAFCDENGNNPVPAHVIVNLRGVAWRRPGVSLERLVFDLAELPPDWFPKNKDEWDAFITATVTIGRHLRLPIMKRDASGEVSEQPIPLRSLYDGCGGKWRDFLTRIASSYMDRRPPEGATEDDVTLIGEILAKNPLSSLPTENIPAAARLLVEAAAEKLSAAVSPQNWTNWLVSQARPDTSIGAMDRMCSEVHDICDAFSRKVLIPTAAHLVYRHFPRNTVFVGNRQLQAAMGVAAQLLFSGKSSARIIETVRQYINRSAEIEAAGMSEKDKQNNEKMRELVAQGSKFSAIYSQVGINRATGSEEWVPLCPPYIAPNGVYVVPLTSKKELQDEGRARHGSRINSDGSCGLAICVGESNMPYISNCRTGGQHILSFRIPTPQAGIPYIRLGCLQVAPVVERTRELKFPQFRGEHNAEPPPEAMAAKHFFSEAIKSGELPIFYEEIALGQKQSRKSIYDDVQAMCGFSWWEEKSLKEAISPWGRFVPKKYKAMSLEEFLRDEVVVKVAAEINPAITRAILHNEDSVAMAPASPAR